MGGVSPNPRVALIPEARVAVSALAKISFARSTDFYAKTDERGVVPISDDFLRFLISIKFSCTHPVVLVHDAANFSSLKYTYSRT
jgi:hypothetical protein